MRREAYERAKERRASDPKYLAMKEEAKKRRREASQVAKERRKAAAEKRKLAGKEREATEPARAPRYYNDWKSLLSRPAV